MTATFDTAFRPNPHYNFPPFFTLQPNLITRQSQLSSWSALLLAYCAHHHIFRLSTSHPIFNNAALKRRLKVEDVRILFSFMVGERVAEFANGDAFVSKKSSSKSPGDASAGGVDGSGGEEVYIWWHSAEEWASVLLKWVEETGQRNTILTFYELLEGDATQTCEWRGMGEEVLGRVVGVLVRRGRAAVIGEGGEGRGVKIW